MRQLAFARTVFLNALRLCCKVGLPLRQPVTLARQLHQPVGQVAGRIAGRHGCGAIIGQFADCLLLAFGKFALAGRCRFDGLASHIRLGARRLGCGLRLLPAHEDEARLCLLNLARQFAITFGLPRLPLQRLPPRIHIAQYGRKTVEVGFGCAQFLLGILAADMQARNPCCLFEHHAPFLRLGSDDRANPALADKRRAMRTRCRIGKDQRDILCAHIAAIGTIGTAGAALDPADNLKLAILVIGDNAGNIFLRIMFCEQGDLGKITRGALRGAGKDHIFHTAAAHRFGRIFAHHPAQSLKQVRFAAAIGADHAGQPSLDMQLSRLDKAFKACEFEPLDPHSVPRRGQPYGLARARFLQLALHLCPSGDIKLHAIEIEGRGALHRIFLAIFGSLVRQFLHGGRV